MTPDLCEIAERIDNITKFVPLNQLPEVQGLYALRNHCGFLRYIGITSMTIKKRVHQYHVAGDGNSHEFSSAYNCGYFWSDRHIPESQTAEASIAKKARREFCRQTCSAIGIALPDASWNSLLTIEESLIRHFEARLHWNRVKGIPLEPTDDAIKQFITQRPAEERARLERQNEEWLRYSEKLAIQKGTAS
jgi:hypothetical protein